MNSLYGGKLDYGWKLKKKLRQKYFTLKEWD
jgi:hypothetical protein